MAIGAALSAQFSWSRLLPTLAAFFLAVGIGAHALDELNGRPLRTEIPRGVLILLAVASIGGAVAIGIVGAVAFDPWIAAFVGGGRLHRRRLQPRVASAAASTTTRGSRSPGGRSRCSPPTSPPRRSIEAAAIAGAVFAFALSLAQRMLSTQVRDVRRRVRRVQGTIERADDTTETLTPELIMGPAERALRILSVAVVALACASVMMRVW